MERSGENNLAVWAGAESWQNNCEDRGDTVWWLIDNM